MHEKQENECVYEGELPEIQFPPSRQPTNIRDMIIEDDAVAVDKTYAQVKERDPNYR